LAVRAAPSNLQGSQFPQIGNGDFARGDPAHQPIQLRRYLDPAGVTAIGFEVLREIEHGSFHAGLAASFGSHASST
jgi:hypothetical protein